jgi:hypothetical protein
MSICSSALLAKQADYEAVSGVMGGEMTTGQPEAGGELFELA